MRLGKRLGHALVLSSALASAGLAQAAPTLIADKDEWETLVAKGTIRAEGFERTGVVDLTGETFQDNDPLLEFANAVGTTFATMRPSAPLPIGEDDPAPPPQNPGVVAGADGSGRFNTTPDGSHFWEATGNFTVAFNAGVSAFGVNVTDAGDFLGSMTMHLLDEGGRELAALLLGSNDTEDESSNNGTLDFFGFADPSLSVYSVEFEIRQFGETPIDYDVFGFDDLRIGAALEDGNGGGTVPEPGTLALLGAGLVASAGARRRRTA